MVSHIVLNYHTETPNNFVSGNFQNLKTVKKMYKIDPVVQIVNNIYSKYSFKSIDKDGVVINIV